MSVIATVLILLMLPLNSLFGISLFNPVESNAATTTNAPVFSLNLVEETDSSVTVVVRLDKGSFNALDFCVKNSGNKLDKCTYASESDDFLMFIMKDVKKLGGTGVSVVYANSGNFSSALTVAYNLEGTDIAEYIFSKKTSDSITADDISFTITSCGIGENMKIGGTAVNNLPKAAQHSHSYTSAVTKAANCTEAGIMTYTCSCGDSYTESIPAAGHIYGKKVTAPTCTAQGYTTYTCSVCKDSYKADYVQATGHSYGEWTVTKAATETATGTKERKCSKCGAVETAVIEKLSVTTEIYRASLDNQGATTPGTIILWYKLNTVENGIYYYYDSKCARPFEGTRIVCPTKSGYVFGGYFTGKNGTGTQYVSADGVCDDSIYRTAESRTLYAYWTTEHVHSYTAQITKAATCMEAGVMTYICSCGDSYTESVPKTDHAYVKHVVAPTCTAEGYTYYTCENCDLYTSTSEKTPATGHSYTMKVTKAATCKEEGVKTFTCSKCGDSYTESIPKTDHAYVKHVVAPTCTTDGYTYYTCENCDLYTSTSEKTPATGHSFGEWTVTKAATETAEGVKEHKCSKCGAVETAVIEKLPITIEIYRASFDNQGADTAGTIILWYKLNTVENGIYYYYDTKCERPFEGTSIICPTKSGYVFGGYFTGKNGTGTQYVSADGVCDDSIYRTAESRTFYAYWTTGHVHSYTAYITKAATCKEAGVKTYICSCGDSYTESIPKTDHTYVKHVVAPTCTADGYTYYTCENCDLYTSTSEKTPATGHSFGEWTVKKAATETAEGVKEHKCSKCGAVETAVIEKLEPQEKVTINNHDISLDYKEKTSLKASSENVEWSSSNTDVVTVDSKGNVKAVGTGSAVVTVTDTETGATDSCNIKVSYTWWQWIIVIVLFGWLWY